MAVNIRGINFHAKPGSRREQVLRAAKKSDERNTDWLPLVIAGFFVAGFFAGGLVATIWPMV